MPLSRRKFGIVTVAGLAGAAISSSMPSRGRAQGTPVRLPLHEFVADSARLAALRRGVAEMKKRKPSDPLSWFFQAAIHGYTDRLLCEAGCDDPEVFNVDRQRLWNQCPHFGQNSANFLPWHRAYTHHFEEIIRLHTGDAQFALPFWDYSIPTNRVFPREFGIEHLDGDTTNNSPENINPLFHAQRDFFLCGYEHPFTDQLPLTELSSRAVDSTRALNEPTFFGANEASGLGGGVYDSDPTTRGVLEQAPHDQIHRAVGGIVSGVNPDLNPGTTIGGMAIPMTAGFDPIFPVHHANIDRIWMKWSCMPGKSWGSLPDKSWFDEKPWIFFDANADEVNRSRKEYFDHRALGVRFSDEDLGCAPLALPDAIMSDPIVLLAADTDVSTSSTRVLRFTSGLVAQSDRISRFDLDSAGDAMMPGLTELANSLEVSSASPRRVELILHDIDTGLLSSTGFDVFLVPESVDVNKLDTSSAGYVGSINLFVHSMKKGMRFDQRFDISDLLIGSAVPMEALQVMLVPYSLTSEPKVKTTPIEFGSGALKFEGYSLAISD